MRKDGLRYSEGLDAHVSSTCCSVARVHKVQLSLAIYSIRKIDLATIDAAFNRI